MVEVAVIGAGAAGLVAARHLLRCGLRACVFESRHFLGGAWSASNHPQNAAPTTRASYHLPQMWDNLTPNLSKYTCSFSDHPWPTDTPTFPSLANMHEYLDDYTTKYLTNDENCVLHLGCTVTSVGPSPPSSNNDDDRSSNIGQYTVRWVQETPEGVSSLLSKDFHGVIVSTGFFSTPVWPRELQELARKQQQSTVPSNSYRAILHSSQYTSPDDFIDQTVAVVGGSFSACEIASDVRRKAKRVVNVLGHGVPYVLPRYIFTGEESGSGGFLPLDYVLYRRGDEAHIAPKVPETIALDQDSCRQRHEYLQRVIGPRKRAQARIQGLEFPDPAVFETTPPLVAISDDYLDLVIDGKIQVAQGRMTKASKTTVEGDSAFDIQLEDGSVLSGIDRIIACTGYRSRLDFLAPEILQTLQYDESDSFAPMVSCYDTFHPQLPGLGFVGMYRGPYFGVMELQARLLAGLLSKEIDPLSEIQSQAALKASERIRTHEPRAQFPHFDYIGLMDSLAELVDLMPSPSDYGAKGKMVAPAFYQPSKEIAQKTQVLLDQEVDRQCDNIPRAALSALLGKWHFEREIHDHLSCTTQYVHGVVAYSLQEPRLDSLRYREDGFLELPNGNRMEVFREYDYLCTGNTLELYFVENGARTYLFLSLKFEKNENGYWLASSDHLCIKDLYKASFQIAFDGAGASAVNMTYRVKGPNKDYEAMTRLSPIL